MDDFFPDVPDQDDIGFDFDEATLIAREKFGVPFLFPWQRFVIANIVDSVRLCEAQPDFCDNEDDELYCRGRQIVLLPTGSGKSMCFLVPAMMLPGATLVFYPLLALMADQKRRMEEAGIQCAVFKGGQTAAERAENFSLLSAGAKVILANPEVLQNDGLLARLSLFKISHVAIDEAHCVFEWGSSFRPAYLQIAKIISRLGARVVTAFTATASPAVLGEIGNIIFGGHFHLLKSESDRANIHYSLMYAYAKEKAVLLCAATCRRPMIVFCRTRARAEEMAHILAEYFGRDKARFYHAGMTKEEKKETEQWFFDSEDGILAATCAYGMGMDKGNIYTVVHLDAPEHLENFCQEAGRAGRKGDDVQSILVWNYDDTVRHKNTDSQSRSFHMGEYALAGTCRRKIILDYLGGEEAECSGCDVCDAKKRGVELGTVAFDAEKVVEFVGKNRRIYTQEEIVRGLTAEFNRNYVGLFKKNVWEAGDISGILTQLFHEGRIKICGGIWKNRLDIVSCASRRKTARLILPRLLLRGLPVPGQRGLEPVRKLFSRASS
ncbi:MAG: ATP-dependent DNA helicase RecQ [Treponema sp.]|nr:ATP-dependent DNA helicase RecQ [Treponema sp.]